MYLKLHSNYRVQKKCSDVSIFAFIIFYLNILYILYEFVRANGTRPLVFATIARHGGVNVKLRRIAARRTSRKYLFFITAADRTVSVVVVLSCDCPDWRRRYQLRKQQQSGLASGVAPVRNACAADVQARRVQRCAPRKFRSGVHSVINDLHVETKTRWKKKKQND